ncbi:MULTISPECIES: YhdB family protein [unclassified Bacillus (in: firmicutes)]|uniref:YhdB family protein n=1 Tax=unclassified Bacillus (in: firmicutes) TaxID=185979 RepID=UPI0023309953|nr:YhdB family protein [Bacillus sp. BP-3]MDC2867657.1 YhdB family protein [Bacillus sp. BP-3]
MHTYTDYDKALYYTYCCNWEKLLVLMVQTEDQLFSKRIEHFLHSYQYSNDLSEIDKQLQLLFQYIDHATQKTYAEQVYM